MKKDSIFKELAEEHGLSVEEVEKACRSQFKFVRDVMERGNDESVRLQYLGMFRVHANRRQTIKNRRKNDG